MRQATWSAVGMAVRLALWPFEAERRFNQQVRELARWFNQHENRTGWPPGGALCPIPAEVTTMGAVKQTQEWACDGEGCASRATTTGTPVMDPPQEPQGWIRLRWELNAEVCRLERTEKPELRTRDRIEGLYCSVACIGRELERVRDTVAKGLEPGGHARLEVPERGWVIEAPSMAAGGAPLWWNGMGLTTEHTKAVRFARAADARMVLAALQLAEAGEDLRTVDWAPRAKAMERAWLGDDVVVEKRRRCRVCRCTDDDCSGCVERTGKACFWAEPDLCSACMADPTKAVVGEVKQPGRGRG